MRYVFSIGLNVGKAEPADQYARTLGAIAAYLPGVIRIAETAGEWEGIRERTLHVLADSDGTVIPPHVAAVGLAGMLRQDAVAYAAPGFSERWLLGHADGRMVFGGSLAEYPIAPGLIQGDASSAFAASRALVEAYADGLRRGGSVAWEDVDAAHALAHAAVNGAPQ